MDSNASPNPRPTPPAAKAPSAPSMGGTVEPANRATVAKQVFQTPPDPETPRYELRDPFAEVTYRSKSFPEMVAKANQLGSSRFIEIDAHGQRTTVQKANGRWEKAPSVPQITAPPSPIEASRRDPEAQPGPATSTPALRPATASERPAAPALGVLAALDAKAERAALIKRIEAALAERYVVKRAPIKVGELTIGRTEYRYRGDTTRVAFTESTFRLATDTNNPSVARSMVDVAQARSWKALRVSGNEDFKRLVWLEANTLGVKTLGYEPTQTDLELLKREREARQVNRIEPERPVTPDATVAGSAPKAKASERGAGGRKAVLAAIEAVLLDKGVPAPRRDAVIAAAAEKLEQRIRAGQTPKVKVYDQLAPSQRPTTPTVPDRQRTRDRSAPTR